MAIDKLNLFTQSASIKPVGAAKEVQGQSFAGVSGGSASANNPFGASTVGINSNIGVGDTMFTSAQAGKKAGMGRTLGFA